MLVQKELFVAVEIYTPNMVTFLCAEKDILTPQSVPYGHPNIKCN